MVNGHALTQREEGAWRGARRGTEKPPLTVLRSRKSSSQSWVSLRPDSPTDPCRGLGRNLLARIRAQRVPSVSPVGAGAEYERRGE